MVKIAMSVRNVHSLPLISMILCCYVCTLKKTHLLSSAGKLYTQQCMVDTGFWKGGFWITDKYMWRIGAHTCNILFGCSL